MAFKSILRILGRRSVATWSSFVAKSLPVFLLPFLIFSKFSPEESAIWFVLITLQSTQLLIAAGTGQPMVRAFAYALGGATQLKDLRNAEPTSDRSPNIELLVRVWSASRFAHILIGVSTLFLLAGMGVWSATPMISRLEQPYELWAALFVFVAGGALRAYGGLHISYLTGVDKIVLLRWCESGFWLVAFVAAAVAAYSGAGLLSLALAFQIPLAANNLWNIWL
jgi:hypothetical protein